ncbi:uncharacterized protein LOC110831606 isoform X2 [Zootermopsis nevadensis]|uniref:Uncharacterized protein n=2 Tax=Zootermopsis nevadensis TaxID=136037 RepID=A0A067R3K4_ZOONE|nr:uncharacterized protein LOC110831606 isoform X2 [Zootermopsis nevadensis]XP_021923491.1 uncharacterized protein LOC110831606 isoform X2 [Zootermopsis nevadensis]KDR17594.1 hypothetical protein L798_08524 [Zootermopsis nevadensis]
MEVQHLREELKQKDFLRRSQKSQLTVLEEQLQAARGIMAQQKTEQDKELSRRDERLQQCEQELLHMTMLDTANNASRNQVAEQVKVIEYMKSENERKNMDIAGLTEKCNSMEALINGLKLAVLNHEAEKVLRDVRQSLYEDEIKCVAELKGQLDRTKRMMVFRDEEIERHKAALVLAASEIDACRNRYLEVVERIEVLQAEECLQKEVNVVKYTQNFTDDVVIQAISTAHECAAKDTMLVKPNNGHHCTESASLLIPLLERMDR